MRSAPTRTPLPLRVLAPKEAARAGRPGGLVPCSECGRCCTYVAVGINAPRTPRYATDVLWYLYHEGVSVHRDADGEWVVIFETRCRNLSDGLLCRVYPQRPHICRAFDNTLCEVNAPDARVRLFRAPAEFLDYLRGWRPRLYARVLRRFVPAEHRPPGAEPPARARRPARRTGRPRASGTGVRRVGVAARRAGR